MEVFMPQAINIKKHTKAACSCRVSVQNINRKTLQFDKGHLLILLKKGIKS